MQPYYLTIIKAELKIIAGLRTYVVSISFPPWSRGSTAHLSSILSLAFSTFTCVFIIPTPRQEHGRSTVIILGVLLANSTAGYPLPAENLQLKAQGGQAPDKAKGKGRTTNRSQRSGIKWG